jgi:hypothetical protein
MGTRRRVGLRETSSDVDGGDEVWYQEYWTRLEASARRAQATQG